MKLLEKQSYLHKEHLPRVRTCMNTKSRRQDSRSSKNFCEQDVVKSFKSQCHQFHQNHTNFSQDVQPDIHDEVVLAALALPVFMIDDRD